jgi:hypothetical protein
MTRTRKHDEGEVECTLQDLLFDVKIIDNPKRTNSEYCRIVVGQVDDGEPMELNYCSKRYELVPNSLIFPKIEEILNQAGIEFEVEYTHINNVRFYADYTITDKRYGYTMIGTNDTIQPQLRVQHSYNGLTKYKIIFGYFRLVCANGLVIAVNEMKQFNLCLTGKHTTSINHSLIELNAMLINFSNNAKQVTQAIVTKYELLGGRMVTNLNDRLAEVLAANKIAAIDNSKFNTLTDISNRIMAEANNPSLGYNGMVNDWLVYNGINQYLYDDSRNIAAPEKRMEVDSKVFEYMLVHA